MWNERAGRISFLCPFFFIGGAKLKYLSRLIEDLKVAKPIMPEMMM
jgi:hypothetical protein